MGSRRRCCCGMPTNFCAYGCGAVPLVGATVTVGSYSPCTTSAAGCCAIPGISAGTYPVTVVSGSTTVYSQSLAITPGKTYSLNTSCCVTVCLTCCDGSVYPYGATVTITNVSTGATVASGTTDSTGCVTLGYASSLLNPDTNQGVVTITSNCSLYGTTSATYNPICGQSISMVVPTADSTAICCTGQGSCVPVASSLTITDANGSHAFVYNGSEWHACYLADASPALPATYNTSLGQCIEGSTAGTYPIRIEYWGAANPCYQGASSTCGAPTSGSLFVVQRTWCPAGTTPEVYQGAVAGGGQCDACSCLTPDCSFGTAPMPTGCSAFAVSIGTMTPSSSNALPDPVGGGVSIS